MVFRAKTRRKRSLIFRFFIIFVAVLFASILALLVVAGSIQISNLQKEAELIANRILDFKVWVIQSTPIKNHAVATKELGDVVSSNSVYSFKIISFNSKDVDAFESQALKAFSENEELTYIDKKEGLIYNYAKPLRANKACLKCHTNYREDQLSGFISVKISNASILPEFELKGGFFAYLTILVAFLLVIYSFAWFELRIIRPLGEIDSILEQVKGGDYGVRIHFKDRGDELGDLANTFNATMDKLVTLIQTDEERRQMQQNILKFLETLSSASEGDLTRRLEVTTDIFGSLADAFNFMVEGLSELIEKVKASAEEVNIDTARIMSVLRQLESGASSQMLQVDKANQSVNKAAISAHEITEKAKVAEEISLNATNAAIDGSKAVKSSLEGIQLIRYTIQAINKRMKYLSERLLEIVTISHLISEIANRTNILAINASIEAMRAGEQGKGFIVISDEIRSLAEKAHKSTKQIDDIINTIQTEAAAVTKHLEEETKYVEMGTNTVFETESAFKQIEKTIKEMGVIISEISVAAEGQKELTTDVVQSMEAVQKVAQEVLSLVQDFTEISSSLTKTSESLISSVERFKLPETAENDLKTVS